jgi:hypothetical protein
MNQKYQIYQLYSNISPLSGEAFDGVLRKNWYQIPNLGRCLFKEARPSQAIISESRSDWSEKVVNELAKLLNLPVAQYELATGYFEDPVKKIDGVISVNCIPKNALVFTGEELLIEHINYDSENPSQYTIENVLRSLDLANVKIPSNWEQPIAGINTGAELFVGYILLDTFANNSDRHDHNWSIMSVEDRLELVPSYDHGLSLGSTDEDEGKLKLELSDYVNRYSQSCFQEGYNKVPNLTVFDRAAKLYPEAAQIWLERLAMITSEQINEIFDRIPEERITPIAAIFAKDLLAYNQTELLKSKSLGNDPIALKDLNKSLG